MASSSSAAVVASSAAAATEHVPAEFLTAEISEISKLSRETVAELQSQYVEPDSGVRFIHCGRRSRVNDRNLPANVFYVYYDQLRFGLRFPICEELTEILKHYGVILAQVMPNSIASLMSYIVFLRRMRIPWSFPIFQYYFSFRVLAHGYCHFPACSSLAISGLESKIPDWKKNFMKVETTNNVGLPRAPFSFKVKNPKRGKNCMLDLRGLVLDIRQYVLEADVLKRVLFSEKYGALSEAEWNASDDRQKNRPQKDQHTRAPRNPRPTPIIFETGPAVGESDQEDAEISPIAIEDSPVGVQPDEGAAEEVQDEIMEEEDAVEKETIEVEDISDEEVGREKEEVVEISESVEEEGVEETQEQKRRRLEKGKFVAEEPAAEEEESRAPSRPKVVISEDRGEVLVDLTQDWYHSDNVAPIGIALFSAALESKMKRTNLSRLIEFSARHHAVSWNLTDYFAEELLSVQEKEDRTAGSLVLQEIENKKLLRELENSRQRLISSEKSKAELLSQLHPLEDRLKAAEASLAENEQKIKQLEEKGSEAHSLSKFRGGVTWCLDRLSKHQLIPAEWNDTDKVLDLVSDSDEERERTYVDESAVDEGEDSSHADP